SGDATARAAPRHDRGFRCESAFENLVPANEFPVLADQESLDPPDEPTLELGFVLQVLASDDLLGDRARFPARLRYLIPSYMDVGPREEVDDFGEYVLEERERGVVRTEDVLVHAPRRAHLEWTRSAAELGVCRERRLRVSRHFDLRDNRYVSLFRVLNDVADLVLGEES